MAVEQGKGKPSSATDRGETVSERAGWLEHLLRWLEQLTHSVRQPLLEDTAAVHDDKPRPPPDRPTDRPLSVTSN